jgi:Iap family predicted aminopeptidase
MLYYATALNRLQLMLCKLHTLVPRRRSSLAVTDKLIQLYTNIDAKDEQDIKKAFAQFNNLYSQYSEELTEVFKKYEAAELSKCLDTKQEDIKCCQNQQDRQIYLSAVELIEQNAIIV